MAIRSNRGMGRALAVSASGVLFGIAVLQAQQGCDRREPAPASTTAPAVVDAPAAAAPAAAEPTAGAPAAAAPNSAPQPAPAAAAAEESPRNGVKPREFFPASKSGGVHMLQRPAPPAPQQQAR